jgi:hypothetical protein
MSDVMCVIYVISRRLPTGRSRIIAGHVVAPCIDGRGLPFMELASVARTSNLPASSLLNLFPSSSPDASDYTQSRLGAACHRSPNVMLPGLLIRWPMVGIPARPRGHQQGDAIDSGAPSILSMPNRKPNEEKRSLRSGWLLSSLTALLG